MLLRSVAKLGHRGCLHSAVFTCPQHSLASPGFSDDAHSTRQDVRARAQDTETGSRTAAKAQELLREEYQPPTTIRDAALQTLETASDWKVAVAGVTGFSLVAYDVFSPSSIHVLLPIDLACHNFAVGLPDYVRLFWGDIVLSDLPIATALLGWLGFGTVAVASRRPEALAVAAVAATFYAVGAGPIHYDPWLVDSLKHIFTRIRPSTIHDSFSFPSGHTSSAAFTMGALIHVLLPAFLILLLQYEKQANNKTGSASSANADNGSLASMLVKDRAGSGPADKVLAKTSEVLTKPSIQPALLKQPLPGWVFKAQGSWRFWLLSCSMTATGRMLADAHWFTDTLAATCLGAATVSVLATLVKPLVLQRVNLKQ